MPAITYDEDTEFGVDLDEEAVAGCSDIDTLLGWSDDCEAVIEDIKRQIEASAIAGCAERSWVFRAGKAMGYMGRARSRITSRLRTLGWTKPQTSYAIDELHRKLAESKARNAVAVEFMRLCAVPGGIDPARYAALESKAIALVGLRDKNAAEKVAARQALEDMAA